MATLQAVKGLAKLTEQLRARAAKASQDPKPVVSIGYTAEYAIWLHEMGAPGSIRQPITLGLDVPRPSGLGVYWGPHGAPKFLERPFRQLSNDGTLSKIIMEGCRKGATLAQALVMAGLRVQRDSMQLVPVEFGLLRASAFTKLETGG